MSLSLVPVAISILTTPGPTVVAEPVERRFLPALPNKRYVPEPFGTRATLVTKHPSLHLRIDRALFSCPPFLTSQRKTPEETTNGVFGET